MEKKEGDSKGHELYFGKNEAFGGYLKIIGEETINQVPQLWELLSLCFCKRPDNGWAY